MYPGCIFYITMLPKFLLFIYHLEHCSLICSVSELYMFRHGIYSFIYLFNVVVVVFFKTYSTTTPGQN